MNGLERASQRLKKFLGDLKEEGNYRIFKKVERKYPRSSYGLWRKENGEERDVTVWCSNDYLGMTKHTKVVAAMKEAIDQYGTGAGGTRNIAGTHPLHAELEEEIATLYGKESALIFGSGFAANQAGLSVIPKLLSPSVIISDERNHASMIQGISESRQEKIVLPHSDIEALEAILKKTPGEKTKIVAIESIYSMEGDIAPMKEIFDLTEKYGAISYVDETHAVGLYGENGLGLLQKEGELNRATIIEGGFGKAFGVVGGFLTGPREYIDAIRSAGKTFIFTTALPPAVVAAILASVRHVTTSDYERKALFENVNYLRKKMVEASLPMYLNDSHIIPCIVGDSNRCNQISAYLMDELGVYLQPINYPTVDKGTERFRITATATHTKEQCDELVEALNRGFSMFAPTQFNEEEIRAVV